MNTDQHLSKEVLWDTTIHSAKVTLTLLSSFEDEQHKAIQDVLPALKALVEAAPSINISQQNSLTHTLTQAQTETQSQIQAQTQVHTQVHTHTPMAKDFIDPNWVVVCNNEVRVKLRGNPNNVVIARTVTNEKELDILIRKVYNSEIVALDCEFMTGKNKLPLLKVLQIAVSKSEGYAIIVDRLGPELLQSKLKPVLEDSSVNFVGWAFKGDALAIKAMIRDIEIAPVLDLQSKLRPVAVEHLNLLSGITKFAPDWEGLEEFQKAKMLGDGFVYYEGGCIWLLDPLPPSALVYSIFDVVSLIVLAQSTAQYPTKESHFWPVNFDGETPKAQNKYNKTLASLALSPLPKAQNVTLNTQSQQSSRNQSVSPQITNNTTINHDKSSQKSFNNQSSSPPLKNTNTQDIDTTYTQLQYNDIMDHSQQYAKVNESGIYFSPTHSKARTTTTTTRPKPAGSWGEFSKQEHSTYLDKSASPKSSTSTPPVKNASLTPRSALKSPVTTNRNIPSPQASPRWNEMPLHTQPITSSSPAATSGVFNTKPDISKLKGDMKTVSGIISDQKVTFTNEENVPGGPEITVWGDFAKSTIQEWEKKHDVGIEAFDVLKTDASPRVQNLSPSTSIEVKTNTAASSNNVSVSEWDKEDERPQYMQMRLNQIPVRREFSGPKATNPNDSDDDSDDDDGEFNNSKQVKKATSHLDIVNNNNTTASSQMKSDASQAGNFENKWQQIHSQNNARSPQFSHNSPQLNNARYGSHPQNNRNNSPAPSTQLNSPRFSNDTPYTSDHSMQGMDVEDLKVFQDTRYLYSGDTIKLCKISKPNELNSVIFPSLDQTFTVTITYHYVAVNNIRNRLKGLQVYLPDGDSYVIIVEQACLNNTSIAAHSKIATLLTHPRINRIAWNPEYAANDIKHIIGVPLGRTVDVSKKANSMGQHNYDFSSTLDIYLNDWPALEQFKTEKENYDKGVRKNFSTLWDRERLPQFVLEYCAMEAAALYTLYQHPDLKSISDESFIFEDH